ncbi:MAG TPA: hypothetical protein VFV72_08545 [Candidatus Limnocylindrales bacterium]|nr:hypothetical protein [Candidatus Limnocylindrales bacterium]
MVQSPADPASEPHRRKHEPGFRLNCGSPLDVPHVGIVFVHGIGSQAAGETLLDWSSKIIALLLDARSSQGDRGDPVIDVQLEPSASSRFIELRLPAFKADDGQVVSEQHWVMTEAWWAERVRPPAFGDMAEWLGPRGALRRIVEAILPRRSTVHDPRLRPSVRRVSLVRGREKQRPFLDAIRRWWRRAQGKPRTRDELDTKLVVKEQGQLGHVYGDPGRFHILSGFRSDIVTLLLGIGAGLYFQAISALVLLLYGALRSVEKILPIGPLKDGALTRPIDRFVLEWFGDVYVLLREPAQAASVRGRLIDALSDLEANGCSPIDVVAHSGGAIVSYMTLTDEANKKLKVDRLITLGQGLNLAWRLLAGPDGVTDQQTKDRYDRLYSDLFEVRKDICWDDFWASQDPAPVGIVAPDPTQLTKDHVKRIRSHSVWNRLAFREDHGTYWDNDEEFLIPLARLLDRDPASKQAFFDEKQDEARSRRRRRRLTFLSIWRQLSLVAPTAAIIFAYARGSTYVTDAAKAVSDVWSNVPGNELITAPVNAVRKLHLENQPFWDSLAEAGVWVIVGVLALLTLTALVAPPERPVPWFEQDDPWWRPNKLFARLLRFGPVIVALIVVAGVGIAGAKFMTGATDVGVVVGRVVAFAVGATLIGAGIAAFMNRSRGSNDARVGRTRDVVLFIATIVVMAVVAVLAITPVAAVLIFEEVGRTVLGFATVIVAFQVIARIGTWRWGVWDGRERVAVRLTKPKEQTKYPPPVRIVVQMILLIAVVAIGFGAIVFEPALTLVAVVGAIVCVLVGIAVDVMDTARGARRDPGDAMAARKFSL